MKKIILTAAFLSVFFGAASAQSYVDNALLFSRTAPSGSARIQAMGGAQVALGGDYSVALSNPAGLGMYNRNEFTFSAGYNVNTTTASFFGSKNSETSPVFNLPGMSLVLHTPSERESGFMGGSFGIALTRLNDLNQTYRYRGVNTQSSIVDFFLDYANGDANNPVIDPDDFLWDSSEPGEFYNTLAGLAYRNYLIEDRNGNNGLFYNSVLDYDRATQEEVYERTGAQYQWSIAYGANFSDKFFVGASLGISTIRFKLEQVYTESDFTRAGQSFQPLDNFSMGENFDIRGSGVNFTVGTTYRPVSFLQIGASFSTPTYYSLTDTYEAGMQSNWNNFDYYPDVTNDDNLNDISEDFSDAVLYEYTLRTPMRIRTGAAFISTVGLISAEVEFVNFARNRYGSEIDGEFDGDNESIRQEFTNALNLSIGGEYRLSAFRLRGGLNLQGDPFRVTDGVDRSVTTLSAGAGYRIDRFYIDVTGASSFTEGRRSPYFAAGRPDPIAELDNRALRFMVTLGFTF